MKKRLTQNARVVVEDDDSMCQEIDGFPISLITSTILFDRTQTGC